MEFIYQANELKSATNARKNTFLLTNGLGGYASNDALPADFDGPLDVILLLLSKNKIEIQNVSITSILEQYLAYPAASSRPDMPDIAPEWT